MIECMRKTFLFALVVASTASCNSSQPETTEQPAAATTEAVAPVAGKPAIAAKIDPVCEMEYDTSWTEYSVHNGDTVHFCSENCKATFSARPEKYTRAK